MVVAMDGAGVRATTAHREPPAKRGLYRAIGIGPGRIAAVGAHRRPVGHRRWRSALIVVGKVASAVHDLPSDDGEIRSRVGDLILRTGEVVTIRHDQIRELADLDASL